MMNQIKQTQHHREPSASLESEKISDLTFLRDAVAERLSLVDSGFQALYCKGLEKTMMNQIEQTQHHREPSASLESEKISDPTFLRDAVAKQFSVMDSSSQA